MNNFTEYIGAAPTEIADESPNSKMNCGKDKGIGLVGNILYLLMGVPMWKVMKAHSLNKRHGIKVPFDDLRSHAMIGGDPILWMNGIIQARAKGLNPDTVLVAAMQIKLGSGVKLTEWIEKGMPVYETDKSVE